MHTPFNPTEFRDVFFASQRILNAHNIEDLRKETLTALQHVFQAHKGTFFLANDGIDRPGLDLGKVVSNGISDKSLRLFRQYYHQLDPFKNKLKKQMPQQEVITFDQIMPLSKLIKTEYYNDFLKPQDIHDQLTIYLTSGNRFLGVTSIFRPENSPCFSYADKAKASLLAPFLTAALERAVSLKKNLELEQTICSIAPDLPYEGILILDRSLTPIYYNDAAHRILSCIHRLDGQHRSFPYDLPENLHNAAKELLVAVINSPPHRSGTGIDLILSTANHAKKVVAHLRAIIHDDHGPKILISINPQKKHLNFDTALRKQSISPRELDLVHLLAEGKKNSEIAEALFISEYTVENHLRSIYRKMDVKNRTALVHKLTQITT
jgi:DNA-binding CsgD family transcriptional regulator